MGATIPRQQKRDKRPSPVGPTFHRASVVFKGAATRPEPVGRRHRSERAWAGRPVGKIRRPTPSSARGDINRSLN